MERDQITLQDDFWSPRRALCENALRHQWRQLEASGCIDNFRIVAGEKQGFREGWFFADSDAYKWLDAAACVYAVYPSEVIKSMMEEFIRLVGRAQMADGYIFTYNQAHFPGSRWEALLIEHELYCHGHLIEAGVSHAQATRLETGLAIARKAADRLVADFLRAGPEKTSGHEEVEIALLRLYQLTGTGAYLDLAREFLERRGRTRLFPLAMLRQNALWQRRAAQVEQRRRAYVRAHPEHQAFQLPAENEAKKPWNAALRWQISALSGKYMQQHAPIREQTVPVGHAVRFTYLETATAMLSRLDGDASLLPAMQAAWDRMVARRMYVTGGLGSVPELEGFGRDDELDPEYAYAETCAALGSLFWNREMARITHAARYSELAEWQLYNAAAVGMGLDGESYLYNNPLASRGGMTRRSWFRVPCCPSNLVRAWATLEQMVCSFERDEVWIQQYIGGQIGPGETQARISIRSGLPWSGKVSLLFTSSSAVDLTLHLRIPTWAGRASLRLNQQEIDLPEAPRAASKAPAAGGYDPRPASFVPVRRTWQPGDRLDLEFEMPILLRRASPRVRGHRGKVVLSRGPLVYCLESVDNPGLDLFSARIETGKIEACYEPEILGGVWVLRGRTADNTSFTAIPYHLWANRGPSQMNGMG